MSKIENTRFTKLGSLKKYRNSRKILILIHINQICLIVIKHVSMNFPLPYCVITTSGDHGYISLCIIKYCVTIIRSPLWHFALNKNSSTYGDICACGREQGQAWTNVGVFAARS